MKLTHQKIVRKRDLKARITKIKTTPANLNLKRRYLQHPKKFVTCQKHLSKQDNNSHSVEFRRNHHKNFPSYCVRGHLRPLVWGSTPPKRARVPQIFSFHSGTPLRSHLERFGAKTLMEFTAKSFAPKRRDKVMDYPPNEDGGRV